MDWYFNPQAPLPPDVQRARRVENSRLLRIARRLRRFLS
jgi:hypothetical protein